jgi:hypothetical protein
MANLKGSSRVNGDLYVYGKIVADDWVETLDGDSATYVPASQFSSKGNYVTKFLDGTTPAIVKSSITDDGSTVVITGSLSTSANGTFAGALVVRGGSTLGDSYTSDAVSVKSKLHLYDDALTYYAHLDTSNLTANRVITLPDAAGTLAVLGLAQSWTAAQTLASTTLALTGSSTMTVVTSATGNSLAITANALAAGSAIALSSTSSNRTATSSLLAMTSSGGSSAELRNLSNVMTNTGNVNIAFYASVSGGTSNYSFYAPAGAFYNAAAASFGGTLAAGGNTTVGGTLTVTGAGTFNNGLAVTGAATVSGSFKAANIYLEDAEDSTLYLHLINSSALTAERKLTFDVGDADCKVTLRGDVTLSNAFATSGGHSLTFVTGAASVVTLPSGTVTLPTNNQIMFIGNTSLAINRTSGALTLEGVSLAPLTIGTGLSGTAYDGGGEVTIALADGYGDTKIPYGSKTAGTVLAAPSNAGGIPSFRALTATDIPTLNQNTSGNAATATTLATSRAINGVGFNGSASITVPVSVTVTVDDVDRPLLLTSAVPSETANQGAFTAAGFHYNAHTGKLTVPTLDATTLIAGSSGVNLTANLVGSELYSIPYQSAANTTAFLTPNVSTTKKFLRMTGTGTAATVAVWDTVTQTDVGLPLVENTALSSWAGTTNITTVGTLTSGTWEGIAVAVGYGGSSLTAFTTNAIYRASTTTQMVASSLTDNGTTVTVAADKNLSLTLGTGALTAVHSSTQAITSFAAYHSGAKTAGLTAFSLQNTATSSTASINKTSLRVSSTGVWNGASTTNYALYVEAAGAATNYSFYAASGNMYNAGDITLGGSLKFSSNVTVEFDSTSQTINFNFA